MVKKIVLNFPKEATGKPIASQLIRDYDLQLNRPERQAFIA